MSLIRLFFVTVEKISLKMMSEITSLAAVILFVTIFEDNLQICVIYLPEWKKETSLKMTSKFMTSICHNRKRNIFEDDLQIPSPAPDTCGGNEALANLLKIQKRPNLRKGPLEEVTGQTPNFQLILSNLIQLEKRSPRGSKRSDSNFQQT